MLREGHGVIVNFSSTSASFGHPYMAAYAASKGGDRRHVATHAIAIDGTRGIRAVAVAPGSIESGITETTPGMLPADADWSLFDKMSPVVAAGSAPPDVVASMIAALPRPTTADSSPARHSESTVARTPETAFAKFHCPSTCPESGRR